MSHLRPLSSPRRIAVADGPSPAPPITGPTTARPVPRWALRAAHAAAVCPLPSALWRLPLAFGVSMGMDAEFMSSMNAHPFWQRAAYLLGLGVIAEGAALLTLGLIRWWGETVPRWFPVVGGRCIPPAVAIVPATLGGIAATFFGCTIALSWPGEDIFANGWTVLMTACYLPLVLWGPLVLAVTFGYYRRRRDVGKSNPYSDSQASRRTLVPADVNR